MKTANRFTLLQILLVLGCTGFFQQAIASPISRQQALQNAQAFLSAKGKNIPQSSLRNAPSKSATATAENYYVFNVGENAGYVIAAGDDCAPAILGYADAGSVDPDDMPSNMKAWLEEYASQIKYMQESGQSSAGESALTATHPAISPLLTTTWDQGNPYNLNCPDFFTYGKSVTGCVATAMAQVMYFHRAKSVTATTATIPAYTCRHKWISGSDTLRITVDAIPAGSPIDWNNMLNSYNSSATTAQQQAVANLMKYCGASVQMDYANGANGGSGAYSSDVPKALKNYFNYSDQTVLKYRNNYSSADDWDNLIYEELSNSRPVLYSGSNSSGGHAFVCDGYDGKGYYHINWGWSGTSDGYFLLSALDPDAQGTGGSSAGYNNNQTAVVYAEPKSSTPPVVTGITFADSNVKTLCLSNWDSDGDGQLTETEAAAVTSLGTVFKNNTTIKTFNELQYFTGLTSLVASAFEGCTALTTVTIPANVTAINSSAFKNCSKLSAITIPAKVTTIGSNAFYGCSSLTTISIPSSVTSISSGAFSYCSGLTNMTVASGNTTYNSNGSSKAIIKTSSNQLIAGCKNTVIPSTVNSIGSYAFQGMTGLTAITIPSGVTSIASYAFNGCSALTSVTVENATPVSIGSTVFSNRANATLYVPAGSKSAYAAASYWKEFKEIIEPTTPSSNNITFADANVKALCVQNWDTNGDGELSEEEAAAVTDLGTVFKSNKSITSFDELQFFTGLTNIYGNFFYDSAFFGCTNLASIKIPSSVTSIGSFAFYDCRGLSSVTIPSGVKSIGSYAFSGCSGLVSIIVDFKNDVFDSRNNCNAIIEKTTNKLIVGCKKSVIPSSVTSIGNNAFQKIEGLSVINIPISVTSIGNAAFFLCSDLSSITIPSNVTSIGQNAFGSCPSLSSITVDNNNIVYDSRNNCNAIIEISTGKLVVGCKNTIIPSSVTSIGDEAFWGCSGLTLLTIPSSVTSIGSAAFYDCKGLASITIPSNVANIGDKAFWGCSKLSSVQLPSGVKKIGGYAFSNTNISSITIPSSVTSIGVNAFYNCNSLTYVTVEWTDPLSITEKTFSNHANATLYVPAGCKAAYEAADYWKEFKEIVEKSSQKYTLDISVSDGAFKSELSHLYDRDGNEYDIADFSHNEFDEGSYIRIVPDIIPYNLFYIREIIVNGESVGTWTDERTAPTEYVIENLSGNTTVEFKTYYIEQIRTLGCIAKGPGKVEMYRNGNYVGVTSTDNPYDTHINLVTDVFEEGDVLKLVFVPDEGSTLAGFCGGPNDSGVEDVGLLADVMDNTYTITFPYIYQNDYPLLRCFTATFEGSETPEPTTNNTLSAIVPTLLLGKQATLSLNLTNEDELIACEFDLQLPDGISIAKDEDGDPFATLSSRASKHSLAVSDKGNGLYHFLCYSNSNKAFSGNEGELLSIELLCDETMTVGIYQATVKNIIFSDVDKNKITPADYTFDLEVIEAEPGDVNNDGEINVMDVVEMVAYIMGQGSEGFVFAAADLDNDGTINVMDLVNLVDLIMHPTASSNAREWTENGMSLSTMADGAVAVKVNNPEQYVASEFIVEVSAGQTLEAVTVDKHHRATCSQLDDSHYKVMTYSSANNTFNGDALVQLHISGEGVVNVSDALLVDKNHKGLSFAPTAGGYTTGINQMENVKLIIENSSVYDLQGKKRDTLRPYKHEVLIVNGKKHVVR